RWRLQRCTILPLFDFRYCHLERTLYITDSSYIISAKEHSTEYSYTGKSYEEVIEKVQESAIELDWDLPSKDSSLNEKSDVISAKPDETADVSATSEIQEEESQK
ncbi:MAG: hypothetical protein LBN43_04770, partial [Oscillospiraceae bacterium]|nr:hypothetical protein [Oscillospiraceae bacterium]